MCVPKNREEILPLLKGCEKDEAGRLAERLDLIEKQIGELWKRKIHCHDSEEIRRASLYTSEK